MTATFHPHAARYATAAARARLIAEIALDRWAPDTATPILRRIADHLTEAADHFDAYTPLGDVITLQFEACAALWEADHLAEQFPHTRLGQEFTSYVLAPISERPLPYPAPLRPASPQMARNESVLAHTIYALNTDTAHQAEQPEAWLREVMETWRRWVQLSELVRVDNARPCNRHARP
ncbi:hypothetical protein ACFC36_33930 [Streptomyces rubiginosohelvolus]|uniref:hypothetical protein n=1 Tax=Streptomyces rubiginosohelvolus TaxID=67362 RepID=UPI0035D61715